MKKNTENFLILKERINALNSHLLFKKENNGNMALGCGFILLVLVILFWLISYII